MLLQDLDLGTCLGLFRGAKHMCSVVMAIGCA